MGEEGKKEEEDGREWGRGTRAKEGSKVDEKHEREEVHTKSTTPTRLRQRTHTHKHSKLLKKHIFKALT